MDDTDTKAPPVILGVAALLGLIALGGTMNFVSGTVAVACAVGAVLCLIVWAGARYIRDGK